MRTTLKEFNPLERLVFGLAGVIGGCAEYAINELRAAVHGHYHGGDLKRKRYATGMIQTGISMISSDDGLFDRGWNNMSSYPKPTNVSFPRGE